MALLTRKGPVSSLNQAPIPYISLFSGAGGLDLGLEAAGFETRVCVDIDPHSCRTLRLNRSVGRKTGLHHFLHNAVVLEADIRKLTADKLRRASRIKGQIPLLVGGPPCQAFSVFGQRKGMEDPRGTLLHEYLRILRALNPKAFLFENVEGLLTVNGGRAYANFLTALQNKGSTPSYKISAYVVEAANFGVPQFRQRVFIFGSLDGVVVPKPSATHYIDWARLSPAAQTWNAIPQDLLKCPRVDEIFDGLPSPSYTSKLPNHVGRKHSLEIIERYRNLEFGERDPLTRINKLHPERPSYTIIVGSDKGGGKGHVHPFEPREVTPRESARAQTFPDWWWFSGTSRHPIRQVGNAVPPLLGAAMGLHVKRHLFGIETKASHEEILRNLGLSYLLKEPSKGPRWLGDLFVNLAREQDGKSVSALWRSVESKVPASPNRQNTSVRRQVVG